MIVADHPAEFRGSREQRRLNYHSHQWRAVGEDEVACVACDCTPAHAAADWPCGMAVPMAGSLARLPTLREQMRARRPGDNG